MYFIVLYYIRLYCTILYYIILNYIYILFYYIIFKLYCNLIYSFLFYSIIFYYLILSYILFNSFLKNSLKFLSFVALALEDGLTGSAWGDWSLYTASPLRAGREESKVARNFLGGDTTSYSSFDPAKELGVQDPIGFWDPLGLSADKDEATFKRRRAVEIKHGRIVSVLDCSEQQCLLKLQVRSTESVSHM